MSIIVAFDSLIHSLFRDTNYGFAKILEPFEMVWSSFLCAVFSQASLQHVGIQHLSPGVPVSLWVLGAEKSSVFSRHLRKQQVYELSRTLVSRLQAPFFVNDSNTEGMVFPVPTCILHNGLFSFLYWTSSGVSEAYRVHCVFVLEHFLARQSVYLLAVLAGDEECELVDWSHPQ